MEPARDPGEHIGHPRVGAEVGQQAIADPAPHLLAVDHHEVDRLARSQRRAREAIPLGPPPGKHADVPLDAGVLRLEVVVDLLQRWFRGRIATAGQKRDRTRKRCGGHSGRPRASARSATCDQKRCDRGACCDRCAELQDIAATEPSMPRVVRRSGSSRYRAHPRWL